MKKLWESRTVWSGVALSVTGAVQTAVLQAPPEAISKGAAYWVTVVCGIVVLVLGPGVVALRAQDRRKVTAGAIVEAKARGRK
jgi:hypothetical protein